MYQSEATRHARDRATRDDFVAVAEAAWAQSAELVHVLWTLRAMPGFLAALGPYVGLVQQLPALLLQSKDANRADAVLQLAVVRATLKPLLARVEILGWLARDHPGALLTLLRIVSVDAAGGRKPHWVPTGRRRRTTILGCDGATEVGLRRCKATR